MHSLKSIFGQSSVIEAIGRAYQADRLPHGLIFGGPAGVGKATTACALAKLFLCDHPNDLEPCGKCSGCAIFDSGNHPDYHVITKELIRYHDKTGKSKGIDLSIFVIRPELIEPANRKAALNRGKVFVIEQADLMNPQAQNAMLKTLEEPYGRTLIILITDAPEQLLQTIRSRCQLFRFGSLDPALVLRELEKRKINPMDAKDVARFARGSLGLALKWIEDGVLDPARELLSQLDTRQVSNLPEWFKKSAEAYTQKQLERDELSSKDQATKEGLGLYLKLVAEYFRLKLRSLEDTDSIDQCAAGIDAVVQAEQYLDGNVNVSLIFQQLTLRLERIIPAIR